MRKLSWVTLFLGATLFASTAVAGPRGIVKNFDYGDGRSGAIDYDEGFVEATAAGTADMRKMANDAQAEMVAKRTARHLAYEVLAETVGKIQIDAKSLYQDAVANVDALKVETHAVIRGAHIVHESVEWRESRRTQEPYPLATVTLRLFLMGREGLGNLLDKYVPAQTPPPSDRAGTESAPGPTGVAAPKAISEPASAGAATKTALASPDRVAAEAGLLIVDVRGLATGYTPAFREYIRDESGEAVYGPEMAAPEVREEGRRSLRYANTLDEAKAIFPEAGQPLVVKAKGSPAPGEITISAGDARAVIQANQAEQFLREARVVLVTE
jgi:hypothetical protein